MKRHYTKVWLRSFFMMAGFIMFFCFQTSCQQETKKSVLVLIFDQMTPEKMNCAEETNDENSGINIICKESLRFTHAYTTSLQPAAATASLLTGQYPLIHQLHRSFDQLSAGVSSVTEAASKQGYKTGFFAGNPHVLKKTGLSKFFDLFDDSAAAQYSNQIIKDFKLTSESFLDWQQEDNLPFFAVLTNSEAEALNDQDTNNPNFDKLDEKLFNFITRLKNTKVWENSYVYFIGLKGSNNYNRVNETSFLNLHSENTLISVLVKPPRMKGDEGISWKNDTLISLADVGFSLKKFFGVIDHSKLTDFPVIDIHQFFSFSKKTTMATPPERNILIEAANTWSKNSLELNFSIINSKYLATEKNGKTEIYSLLTDSFEVVNIADKTDTDIASAKNDIQKIRSSFPMGITHTTDFSSQDLAKDYLRNTIPLQDLFVIYHPRPSHPLYVYDIHQQIKFKQITSIELNQLDRPYQSCIKLLNQDSQAPLQLKECQDPLFVDYLKYKKHLQLGLSLEKTKLNYDLSRKKFFEELKISTWNLALENIWGLFKADRIWYHPLIYLDTNFTTGI